MLGALSKQDKLSNSSNTIIVEFEKVMPSLVDAYKEVVSNLSTATGTLTNCVNEAMSDLECSLKQIQYMNEFNQGDADGRKKEVNIQLVMKCVQKLTNIIAVIAETAINKCDLATPEVQDALIVLSLILDHLSICVQGIIASSQAILQEQKSKLPMVLRICSISMHVFIREITRSIGTITFPTVESVTKHLQNLVKLTKHLNDSLGKLFGLFEVVTVTAGQITRNLSKGIYGPVRGISNGLTNILKGIFVRNSKLI